MIISVRLKRLMASAIVLSLIVIQSPINAMGQTTAPEVSNSNSFETEISPQRQLQHAQRAMQDGELHLAEHFIQTAETFLKQSPGNVPLTYTPEMARAQLATLQGKQPQAAAQSSAPVTNSFTDSTAVQSTPPAAVPGQTSESVILAAQRALLKSRQALAHGDVATATTMLESAKQYSVDFKAIGDSPDTISGMIERQTQLAEMAKNQDQSYNAGAASFLLTQAEALAYYQDFETAEMLIGQAKRFPVEFSPSIGDPEKLLMMIAASKQAAEKQVAQNAAQNAAAQDAIAKQAAAQRAAEREAARAQANTKTQVLKLLSQAQLAMDQEQWQSAKTYIDQAKGFNVPENQFAANEPRPWQLELKVQNALNRLSFDPAVIRTNFQGEPNEKVVQADYVPETDTTQNVQVASFSDDQKMAELPNSGLDYYQAGVRALNARDTKTAALYLKKAWLNRSGLDGITRKAIKDQLMQIDPSAFQDPQFGTVVPASQESSLDLATVDSEQQSMFRKLQSDVFKERAAAERLLEKSPREALEKMTMVRGRIAQSNLSNSSQRPLLTIIDRDINEMQKYIEQNLPDIINDETNMARTEDIERRKQRRLDVEYQIQKLVEEFNDLVDEKRYAEAQVVARTASGLNPDSEIAVLLREKAAILRNLDEIEGIRARKAQSFVDGMNDVEKATIGWNEDYLVTIGDKEKYLENAQRRLGRRQAGQYDSEIERQIWNKLKNEQVQGEYRGTLAEAIDQLSRQAGVNIVFDEMSLRAEGIKKDTLVDVPIRSAISLKSALEVILSSAGLVFVVDSEVIKVTSRDAQNSKLETQTYYIGDLVMPLNQNQDPTQLRFTNPYQSFGNNGGVMNASAANSLQGGGTNQLAMAQQIGGANSSNPFGGFGYGGNNNGPATGMPAYNTMGGQKLGGVTEDDFLPLIELIQNTIQNESWLDTGQGLGTIQAFVPNLSLIVSQTQEVQDEIQDLLKKLRELNDVQIVVEVRFIRLDDQFFERVGVDFDFSLNDNSGVIDPTADVIDGSRVVGRSPVETAGAFTPTSNLDLQFLQNSFTVAQPLFGGFEQTTAASFGFAILSDIEVFFLIEASKGDQRTNIMQAPTVTMFNGQSASVNDNSVRPFVTSVIPVVGDFAVAHQPVITMLPDGTSLNVQAVVSDDRRHVRLSLVPFFTQITEVRQFTFDGSTTTDRSTDSVLDDLLDAVDGDGGDASDDELRTQTQGITVQQPVIAVTSVSTVVSVPDGGTILMGGIKRMNEGRIEQGIPFLSSIPYVNRLFKNVGIGHETSNLMMMVTPRIIIQSEIEAEQVGNVGE